MRRLAFFWAFLLIAGTQLLLAQTVQIKGKVTSSEDGSALPGASVIVKGTSVATVTDADGNYSLNAPAGAASVIVSFVGMTTQEVQIAGQTKIDVVLKSEVKGLEEVVVTALGITRSEKSVGYTVTSVNSEEVKQKSEPDALRSLEGKIPGVNISSTSGAPGSSTRVNIRGISSIYGSNEPLYIVDGTPYSNEYIETNTPATGGGGYLSGLSSLDPNDIESISVLKGAAASALYGSRASSGVVMITTKSGSSKKANNGLEISLNSSVSFEQVAGLPDYQNDFGAGSEFNFAAANGSWGPRFTPGAKIPIWGPYKGLPGMPDSIPYQAYPNNVKDLFKTGVIYDNSVNINSSTEKSNFNITASDLHQSGYIPHSSFLRQGISVGGNTKLEHGFSFNGNVSYSHNEQDGSFYGDNQVGTTSSSFARTLFLNRAWDMGLPYTNPKTGASLFPVGSQADNPLWAWENNTITTKTDRIVANAGTTLKIGKSLEFKYQVGINTYNLSRLQVNNIGSRAYGGEGFITQENTRTEEIESNFLATYDKKLLNDFELKLIVGQSTNQQLSEDLIINGQTMVVPQVYTLDNTKSITSGGTSYSQKRIYGVFGDAEFSYKNYLFLTVTTRNDWSSTLPPDKRSYMYPSVSGSFIFSDALSLNSDVFSLGKLRLSWAKVGKDNFLTYAYNGKYFPRTGSDGFPFNGQPAMLGSQTAYGHLTPEFSSEIEMGTELNFFKSRIGFDFTYYSKDSKNQIVRIKAAPSSGFQYLNTNLGDMTNKGVEISLKLVPVKLSNSFTWDINFAYTKNVNKVVSLQSGLNSVDLENGLTTAGMAVRAQVGQPYGVFFGSVAARDSKGNLLIDPSTGTLIAAKDHQIIGDPNPKFNLGITNNFSFKGIHLNFLFDYKKGGDIYSTTIQNELGRGVTKDTKDREATFIVPGYYGDPNTGKPLVDKNGNEIKNTTQVAANEIYFGTSFATNGPDEFSVYDGTYYRLRELSLGYDLPKTLYNKLPLSSIGISLVGRNLWYFCPNVPKYTNFDTEVNAYGTNNVQGIEFSSAPSVRRYGISLKITF